jgi:AraC family transcriptional regulator
MRYPVTQTEEVRRKAVSEWLPSSEYELTDAPEIAVNHWFYRENDPVYNQSRYIELWLPIVKNKSPHH